MQHVTEKARKVQVVIFDVDGVLTDGSLYLTDGGEEIKAFNSHDGHGIKMLKASGVKVAIITGRESRCVDLKAIDLGIRLGQQVLCALRQDIFAHLCRLRIHYFDQTRSGELLSRITADLE